MTVKSEKKLQKMQTSAKVPTICDGPAPAPINNVVVDDSSDHDGT